MNRVSVTTWPSNHKLIWLLPISSASLGLILALCGHAYSDDSVSYLDMGDAFFAGNWRAIFNGLWSPLYPLLLGFIRWLVKPSMHWEGTAVQLANWVVFLCAILSFRFFWGELLALYRHVSQAREDNRITLSGTEFWLLGYVIFLFMHLNLVTSVTPDMLLSTFVYLASGLLVKIILRGSTLGRFCALGLVLGLGFLTKTVMLPLAGVYLVIAAVSSLRQRSMIFHLSASIILFCLLAGPYVTGLSKKEGRFTVGDAGALNYSWHVNGAPTYQWQSSPPGSDHPEHAIRMILASPQVFEFGEPIIATYPPWYDPAYWNAGLHPRFEWAAQIETIKITMGAYLQSFWDQGVLIGGLLILLVMRRDSVRTILKEFLAVSPVWVPALAAFSIYGVIWVEPRYVAQFFVLFWGAVLTLVHLPNSPDLQRLVRTVVVLLVIVMGTHSLNLMAYAGYHGHLNSTLQTMHAERLRASGLYPGIKVAIIDEWSTDEGWQQIAKLRVVAVVTQEDQFWATNDAVRSHVYDLLAQAGVKYVIASAPSKLCEECWVPEWASRAGWVHVDDTPLYLFRLN